MFERKGPSGKREEDKPPHHLPPPGEHEFLGARKVGAGLSVIGDRVPDPNAAYCLISQFLVDQYKDKRGVHVETLLNSVGALAGFAAQEAIWEGAVRTGKLPAEKAFVRVSTKDGSTYYFGDILNTILVSTKEGELSIWRLVAGAAVHNGAEMLPNLSPLFEACAKNLGGPQFGVPAWAASDALQELPWDALRLAFDKEDSGRIEERAPALAPRNRSCRTGFDGPYQDQSFT